MSTPSSNLLAQALTVIKPSPIKFFKTLGRSSNDIGLLVSQYADPVTVMASVQAVARNVYEQFGLDFQKNYIQIWLQVGVIDINRDTSGDQVDWNCRRYECKSDDNWYNVDGWMSVMCVDIGKALPIPVPFIPPP